MAAQTVSNIACESDADIRTLLFESRIIPDAVKLTYDNSGTSLKLKTALLGVPCNALQSASVDHLSGQLSLESDLVGMLTSALKTSLARSEDNQSFQLARMALVGCKKLFARCRKIAKN